MRTQIYSFFPFFVFVTGMLITSLLGISVSPLIMLLPCCAIAFLGYPFKERFSTFLKGAGDSSILLMCFIYILSGVFTGIMESMQAQEALSHSILGYVPSQFLLIGSFLLSALIATAMGTSMGTIATMGPLMLAIAHTSTLPVSVWMGTLIGGAMFGDNLSQISDTTVAALSTQKANALRKFRLNLYVALPATLCTVYFLSQYIVTPCIDVRYAPFSFIVLPYFIIILLSFICKNVVKVLFYGNLYALATYGVWAAKDGALQTSIMKSMQANFEIIALTLLVGGLSSFLPSSMAWRQRSLSPYQGGLRLAGLITVVNSFLANNTIAILLSGKTAASIADKSKLSREKTACLLDIFSCVSQGLLPHSPQLLLAASMAHINVFSIIPHVMYCVFLGIVGIVFCYLKEFSYERV